MAQGHGAAEVALPAGGGAGRPDAIALLRGQLIGPGEQRLEPVQRCGVPRGRFRVRAAEVQRALAHLQLPAGYRFHTILPSVPVGGRDVAPAV